MAEPSKRAGAEAARLPNILSSPTVRERASELESLLKRTFPELTTEVLNSVTPVGKSSYLSFHYQPQARGKYTAGEVRISDHDVGMRRAGMYVDHVMVDKPYSADGLLEKIRASIARTNGASLPMDTASRMARADAGGSDLAANGGSMGSKRTGKAVGGASQFGNTLGSLGGLGNTFGSIGSIVNPLGGAARPAPVVAGARPIGVPPPVAPWAPPVPAPPVPAPPVPGVGGGGGGGGSEDESSQGPSFDPAYSERPFTPSSPNPYASKPVYGNENTANALALAGAATGFAPLSLAAGAAKLLIKDETNTSRWQNWLPGVSKALTGHDPENYRQQLTAAAKAAADAANPPLTPIDLPASGLSFEDDSKDWKDSRPAGGWDAQTSQMSADDLSKLYADQAELEQNEGDRVVRDAPQATGEPAAADAGAAAAADDASQVTGETNDQDQTTETAEPVAAPEPEENPSARGGRITRADGGQAVSSAATSRHQVAALLRSAYLARGTANLDYGGGKYDKGTEFLRTRGVENHVFDPFNRTREHNDAVLGKFKDKAADSATVANVLNVIKEPMLRAVAIRHSSAHVRDGGKIHFSVYAGDRSGKGEQTRDGWQNNMPLRDYLAEVRAVHPDADIYGNAIVATKRPNGASRG